MTAAQPMLMQASPPMQPVTVEQTEKTWKVVQLCAGLAIFFGFLAVILGTVANATPLSVIGWLLLVGGFAAYLVARFGAWWSTG